MADDPLAGFVTALMDEEILPTLEQPDGMPLAAYTRDLRNRFANSALEHRTWQIAMDGSQKLPQRLLHTIRDRIDAGKSFDRLALAVAAWIVYATGQDLQGKPIDVRDPLAERLAAVAREAGRDPHQLTERFTAISDIFSPELSGSDIFKNKLAEQLSLLLESGPRVAAGRLS
jgi:fructuronate reductase